MKFSKHIPQLLITVVGGVIVAAIAAKFINDEGSSGSVLMKIEGSNISASANSNVVNSVNVDNTNIVAHNGSVVMNDYNPEVSNNEQLMPSLKSSEVSVGDMMAGGGADEVYVLGSNNRVNVVLDSSIEKIKKYEILNSNGDQKLYLSGKYTVKIKNLGANNIYKIPKTVGPKLEVKDLGANTVFTSY
jgi:hypothetical protein